MKYLVAFSQVLVFGLLVFPFSPPDRETFGGGDPSVANVIEGTVYDPHRRPVPDLWVELQNEFNMSYRRVRTGSSGRYTFSGLSSGRYVIKVYTSGTDFEEQTETVEIINVVQNSSDTVYQDVTLHYRKGMGNAGIAQMTEAVFVQDVPEEARRLYKSGVKDLAGKDYQKGEEALDQAIKIFPDYYDALNALGCNYVDIKEYQKSLPYLIHSIDVNQRSFSSFYSLAYAAYKLHRLPEATEAARGATILQPNSVNSQLLYGTLLRLTGNLDQALITLSRAEKLSKDAPVAEIHWQLALLYNKLNKYKEAADELERYLKIEPDAANKKEIRDLIQTLRSKSSS